ncbi:MAG: hypothetical protein WBX38_17400 [Candidatus Sulfotelmatobacter sp.]
MEGQEMYEQEMEGMREHLNNLADALEQRKNTFKPEKYDKLSERLKDIHSNLDEIDAMLYNEAIMTDKPDKDVLGGVTF